MSMLLLLDSNFRASLRFGARQLQPVFSDAVQAAARGAPDRVSLVSQVTYYMRTSPPSSKVALIFGSFENMLTGRRSTIQRSPLTEVRSELASYVTMLQDLLRVHPSVVVYVLAPLYRSQPAWYESVYGEVSTLFCSEVSHVDPVRVRVVPPVDVPAQHLDPAGVHFDHVVQQLVVAQLLLSFQDGVFVDPSHYPLAEPIGLLYLHPEFDIKV